MPLCHRVAIAAILGLSLTPLTYAAPGGTDTPAKKESKKKSGPVGHPLQASDADNDGKLTLVEIHRKYPNFPATRFMNLDKNGDGFLDGDELPNRAPKADTSDSRNEAKSAKLRYLAKLVKKHDANSDGQLSLEELQSAKPGFPAETFSSLDHDKSGFLNAADLSAPEEKAPKPEKKKARKVKAKAPTPENDAAKRKDQARKADTDKDGRLSFEEASAAYPKMSRERFDARDKNGDGFLDREDRKKS